MWGLIDRAVTCAICSVKTSMKANQPVAHLVAILPSRLLGEELSAILCVDYVYQSQLHVNQAL